MKILKLINNETSSMIIKPLKASNCIDTGPSCDDYCGPIDMDFASCPVLSADVCYKEDYAACTMHSQDYCPEGDYRACTVNQTDWCYTPDYSTCNEAAKYDITD